MWAVPSCLPLCYYSLCGDISPNELMLSHFMHNLLKCWTDNIVVSPSLFLHRYSGLWGNPFLPQGTLSLLHLITPANLTWWLPSMQNGRSGNADFRVAPRRDCPECDVLRRCRFLWLSPALPCWKLTRSQRIRRNKEDHHPNSQHFYPESLQDLLQLDILVFSSSKSRAPGERGPHLPGMCPYPGFWLPTQPKSDKEIKRKVGKLWRGSLAVSNIHL